MTLFDEHKKFTVRTAAPPRVLLPEETQLMHAALGLSTEILELCLSKDKKNTEEELGDTLWYLHYCATTLGISAVTLEMLWEKAKPHEKDTNTPSQKRLLGPAEELISEIKKVVIYKQPRGLTTPFLTTYQAFCRLVKECNLDINVLMSENIQKLNKRYTNEFTTKESIERKDKS